MNLPPIDSDSLSKNLFINKEDTISTRILRWSLKKAPTESYWVVSIVPDAVPKELEGSLYNQKGWLVEAYYDIFEMEILRGLGISLAVMLLSFVFLVYAAGHRRGADGIVLTMIDRIPIDVFKYRCIDCGNRVVFYGNLCGGRGRNVALCQKPV